MSSADRDKVISAIKQLGRRVTVGDVAGKTGLPLLAAGRSLNAVAADCRGNLEVAKDGTLVYSFAPAFETAYLKTGFARWYKDTSEKGFQLGYYLLRISFGATLIASLVTVTVLIVLALIVLLSKGSDSSSGDGGGGGGGSDFDLSWLFDVTRFFAWDINYGGAGGFIDYTRPSYEADYAAYTQGKYVPKGQSHEEKPQGFVLDCFSYLFGDGNPNEHIEEQKWALIAEHIRRNNGVTTAEQLACYTGANPRNEYEALPVLVRFDGQPVVTESGNIVYTFPSMQMTATNVPAQHVRELPPVLEEKRWNFSMQPASNFLTVGIFAILNFAGCMWLMGHIGKVELLHHMRYLIDWLSVYAVFFLLFPAIRYLALIPINARVKLRNHKRNINLGYLKQKEQKLQEARQFAISADHKDAGQIVYTTEKDVLEQQFENN